MQPDAPALQMPSAMPLGLAIAPVVLVILLNHLLSAWLWPAIDTPYLVDDRFAATSVQAVRGLWAVIGALSAAIVLLAVLWWLSGRAGRDQGIGLKAVLEEGAGASVMPLMKTASQVGFGAVIASLAGFALIRDAVVGIAPDLLHRVTAIATGGLDALPRNGAVITLLGICKLTHRQSYPDIFVVAVAGPLLALAAVVSLGSLFGSF